MFDPTATYRTAQVTSANGLGQIVLLYQGAIRFARQHVAFLEQHRMEEAHRASLRCQDIVIALRVSLDASAGDLTVRLDQLYEFALRRLFEGNMAKDPRPTEEAIQVLRGLLEAWQEVAAQRAGDPARLPSPPAVAAAGRDRSAALAGSVR